MQNQYFQCPRCGTYNNPNEQFCGGCGNRLLHSYQQPPQQQYYHQNYQQQPPINQQIYTCPNCKQPVQYGIPFCSYCRLPLNWPSQTANNFYQQEQQRQYGHIEETPKNKTNPWLIGILAVFGSSALIGVLIIGVCVNTLSNFSKSSSPSSYSTTTSSASPSNTTPTSTPTPNNLTTTLGNSRSNAVPIGQSLQYGNETVKVIKATKSYKLGDGSSSTPGSNMVFLIITLQWSNTSVNQKTEILSVINFRAVGDKGKLYEWSPFGPEPDNALKGGEYLAGTTVTGDIVREIAVDDTNLMLMWNVAWNIDRYFNLGNISLTGNIPTPTVTKKVTISYSGTTTQQISDYNKADSGCTFLVINFDISNQGYDSFSTNALDFSVIANSIKYNVDLWASVDLPNYLKPVKVMSGGTTNGSLVFEVPSAINTSNYTIKYADNSFNIVWVKK